MERTKFLELVEKNTNKSRKNYPANYATTSIILDFNRNLKTVELHEIPEYGNVFYEGILKQIIQSQYDLLKTVQQTL